MFRSVIVDLHAMQWQNRKKKIITELDTANAAALMYGDKLLSPLGFY